MNVNMFSALAMLLPFVAFMLGSGLPSSQSDPYSDRFAELNTDTREARECAQIVQTLGEDSQIIPDDSPTMKELHPNLHVQNFANALKIKRPSHLHGARKTKKTRARMTSSSVADSGRQVLPNTSVHRKSVSSTDLKSKDPEESYKRFLENLIGAHYDLSNSSNYMSDSPPWQGKYKLIEFPEHIRDHSIYRNKAKWVLRFKNSTTSPPVSRSDMKHLKILRIQLVIAVRVPKASYFRPQKIALRVHLRLEKRIKLPLTSVTRDMLQSVQWMRLDLPLASGHVILNSPRPQDYIGVLKVTCKRPAGQKCDFVGPVDRVSRAVRKIRKGRVQSRKDFQYRPYLEITYSADK